MILQVRSPFSPLCMYSVLYLVDSEFKDCLFQYLLICSAMFRQLLHGGGTSCTLPRASVYCQYVAALA
jgi:hypothetical protein